MPIAVPPVDGKIDTMLGELRGEFLDERAVLCVYRRHATEAEVVLTHDAQALERDVASAGDVLQERDDIIRALRTAERDDQQRIEHRGDARRDALERRHEQRNPTDGARSDRRGAA